MRKEIIADFDEVQKHLKEGWTVEIGGDPVTHGNYGYYVMFRGLTVGPGGHWKIIADRTAVCTKEDEPVIGFVPTGRCRPGYLLLQVEVPHESALYLLGKPVEIRAVEP